MHKKSIIRIAILVALLLLIPFFGNYFIEGWNWGVGDFIIAAVLLFGTGLALEFAAKSFTNRTHRILACIAILVIFLLIWAELAVGLFGTPFAGN